MNIAAFPTSLSEAELINAINAAPRLPSLRRLNEALKELLTVEWGVTSQIAEVIRRDPVLVTRLLKWSNSSLFALENPLHNIEEAILFLGLRQIKQLVVATPVLEDVYQLACNVQQELLQKIWRYALGSAVLTREILLLAGKIYEDEADYLLGLLHPIGHILMASLWPEYLDAILRAKLQSTEPMIVLEKNILGWDHAELGAYYLSQHHLKPAIVEGVRFHPYPHLATDFKLEASAVSLAHFLLSEIETLDFEGVETPQDWMHLPEWKELFGEDNFQSLEFLNTLRSSARQWMDFWHLSS